MVLADKIVSILVMAAGSLMAYRLATGEMHGSGYAVVAGVDFLLAFGLMFRGVSREGGR